MRQIGTTSLGDGYGVAVSASGEIYVADAADNTVKVYDPADSGNFPDEESATIDGSATSTGEFTSLRDAALAVDRVSGNVYVLDNTQPANTEQPRARVHVFSAAGTYLGHLKYDVVHGAPTGIAVDNSATGTQGRVYVTSGNTHFGGVYVYAAGSAITATPRAPTIPPTPPGGDSLFPTVPIGGAAPPPGGISCEGDACQVLPPDPVDPTLTTLLPGLGNPKPRYVRYRHRAKKKKHGRQGKHRRHRAATATAKARTSLSTAAGPAASAAEAGPAGAPASAGGGSSAASAAAGTAAVLLPGAAGFDAAAYANGAVAATQAGSHPYSLEFSVALDQSGGRQIYAA